MVAEGGLTKAANQQGLPLLKKLSKGTEEPKVDRNASLAIAQLLYSKWMLQDSCEDSC